MERSLDGISFNGACRTGGVENGHFGDIYLKFHEIGRIAEKMGQRTNCNSSLNRSCIRCGWEGSGAFHFSDHGATFMAEKGYGPGEWLPTDGVRVAEAWRCS